MDDRPGTLLCIGDRLERRAAGTALAPAARVIAFETVVRVGARLATNVALNGSPVMVENLAVSDHDGVATIQVTLRR